MIDSEVRAIADAVKRLQQKLDLLSAPLEQILTNRVAENAKMQITRWISAYFLIAVAALGYVGYNVHTFLDTVSEQVKLRATEKIQDVVVATVTPQVRILVSSQADTLVAEAAAQADDALMRFEQRLTAALKDKDPEVARALGKRGSAASFPSAFAYYRHQLPDGTWVERYFRSLRPGEKGAFPQPGEEVVALGYVNARKDFIRCSPTQGCVNAPIEPMVGVIRPDDRLEVIESRTVHEGFVWIKFKRKS